MFIKSLIRSNRIMAFSVISPCIIVKLIAHLLQHFIATSLYWYRLFIVVLVLRVYLNKLAITQHHCSIAVVN